MRSAAFSASPSEKTTMASMRDFAMAASAASSSALFLHRIVREHQSELRRGRLRRLPFPLLSRMLRIGDDRDALQVRHDFLEERQPLAAKFRPEKGDAGDVAARMAVAGGDLRRDRIGAHAEHDGLRDTGAQERAQCGAALRHDDVRLRAQDVAGHLFESLFRTVAPPGFDEEILAFDVATAGHALAKRGEHRRIGVCPVHGHPGYAQRNHGLGRVRGDKRQQTHRRQAARRITG